MTDRYRVTIRRECDEEDCATLSEHTSQFEHEESLLYALINTLEAAKGYGLDELLARMLQVCCEYDLEFKWDSEQVSYAHDAQASLMTAADEYLDSIRAYRNARHQERANATFSDNPDSP